jgi:pyruvate formate lyase activating enzyme
LVGGKVVALGYGAVTSASIDPIEKKPLYHFHPGCGILSIGTFGCNLTCKFCQNWEISQREADHDNISPEDIARTALANRGRSVGVAYTYSEPLVWYEFVLDCAKLIRQAGLVNVLVTNGQINPEPLAELLPYVDAMNIDLKAFRDEFYRKVCGGRLEPVLDTIKAAFGRCHIELTTLIIPGMNDSPEEIDELAAWICSLSPDIPLHLSRYFPNYVMDIPPTPVSTLVKCREVASRHLRFVYVGNAEIPGGNDTVCPSCGETLIERRGFLSVRVYLDGTACPKCGASIPVRRNTDLCAE